MRYKLEFTNTKIEYKLSLDFPFTTSVYWYTVYGGCSYGYDEWRAPSVQRVAAEPPPLTHHTTHLEKEKKNNDRMIWIFSKLYVILNGILKGKGEKIWKFQEINFTISLRAFWKSLQISKVNQCSVNGNFFLQFSSSEFRPLKRYCVTYQAKNGLVW